MMRLNPGTAVAGIVAILLSVSGAFLARQFLLKRPESPPPVEKPVPKVETALVPVATIDLPVNRVVRKGDIGTLRLTKEELSKKKLPPTWISNPLDIGGRILKRPIKALDAFSPEDLFPEGTGPSVADDLEPGLRAVTISVNNSGFVDGFATPGTFVDVLFRLNTKEGDHRGRQPVTYTILNRVKVLAVERASFPGTMVDPANSKEPAKVTLAVTPEQAGQLRVLEGNGELSLSLRSPGERTRETIQTEQDEASELLAKLRKDEESLNGIISEASEAGLKFDDKGRMDELKKKISGQEQIVARLEEDLKHATVRPEEQRLAEVLKTGPRIGQNLPPGMRAVTVAVKGSGFVDGFAVAGTFVDVLFRLPQGEGRRGYKETTFAVVERVEVLAVDQSTEPIPAATTSAQGQAQEARVTLAVTADQASKLKVIEGRGELSLAIRSPDERTRETVEQEIGDVNDRLTELQRDAKSLNEIIAAAAKIGAEFDDKGRAAELRALIAEQEQLLAKLNGDLKLAVKVPEQQRLDEVLKLGSTPTIVEKLPQGKRAVTVSVKGSGFVDGYAVAGTSVDVLFRLSQLEGRKDYKETTFTVVEGVEVLAVDQSTDPAPQSGADTQERGVRVTLAVTPDQAARLKVIEGRGELSLLLRSPKEMTEGEASQPGTTVVPREGQVAMEGVKLELEELRIEQEALRQIEQLSARRGVPFSRQRRLEELQALINGREEQLTQLQAKESRTPTAEKAQGNSDSASTKYTLAAVLGIPEPVPPAPEPAPPPTKAMDIYMGGKRRTIMFEQSLAPTPPGTPTPASAPTAAGDPTTAGAPKPPGYCKECEDKKKYPGRTVIRVPAR